MRGAEKITVVRGRKIRQRRGRCGIVEFHVAAVANPALERGLDVVGQADVD